MRWCLGLLLWALASTVSAQCPDPLPADTVCVEWQAPTENVDGTPIPASGAGAISHYRIYWSLTAGDWDGARSFRISEDGTREFTADTDSIPLTRNDDTDGDGNIDLFFIMRVTNNAGEQSGNSNVVAKVINLPDLVPGAPTILDVLINIDFS